MILLQESVEVESLEAGALIDLSERLLVPVEHRHDRPSICLY